ncbi:RNA polymerase sigma factor [Saccharothrix isguenensis]
MSDRHDAPSEHDRTPEFDEFFHEMAPRMLRRAARRGVPYAECSELVQDVMGVVWDRWHRIEEPRAYAMAVLRNRISGLLSTPQQPHVPFDEEQHARAEHDEEIEERLRELLLDGVQVLPAHLREVIELYLQDIDTAGIATRIGRSTKVTSTYLWQAKKRLRELVHDEALRIVDELDDIDTPRATDREE